MKNIRQEGFIGDNTIEKNDCQSVHHNEVEDSFDLNYEDKKKLLDWDYLDDFNNDPDKFEIYVSCEDAKRRILEMGNIGINEPSCFFETRYHQEYGDRFPDMNPILDMFHIKNFDVDYYLQKRFGDDQFYDTRSENPDIRNGLKLLNLVYYPADVITKIRDTEAPALFYDEDVEFIDSWDCPISKTIEIYLHGKFSRDPMLEMFMISKFRKYCSYLAISNGVCCGISGKLSFKKN